MPMLYHILRIYFRHSTFMVLTRTSASRLIPPGCVRKASFASSPRIPKGDVILVGSLENISYFNLESNQCRRGGRYMETIQVTDAQPNPRTDVDEYAMRRT